MELVFSRGTPTNSLAQNPSVSYTSPGTYSVTLTCANANGSNTLTRVTWITVSTINTLPLTEGFVSTTFPPTNWTSKDVNSDGVFYTRSTTAGQASSESMVFDNYNFDVAGARDEIRTPKYNFSSLASATMAFWVAYEPYDLVTYSDSLAVMISTDCGVSFTQAYLKGGATLSTVAGTYTTSIFVPTTTQWRQETINLNPYCGQSNVMVAFQNHGRYGQAIYIDNININGLSSGTAPTSVFTAPAIKCSGISFTLTDASTGSPTSWLWSTTPSTGVTITSANSQNLIYFLQPLVHIP